MEEDRLELSHTSRLLNIGESVNVYIQEATHDYYLSDIHP
jgi:hypothetical protein